MRPARWSCRAFPPAVRPPLWILLAAFSVIVSALPVDGAWARGPAERVTPEQDSVFPAEGHSDAPPAKLKLLALSLLLPGLGHRSLGESDRFYGFVTAEASIWGVFTGYNLQGKIRKDSYVEMAHLSAGVSKARGRSDEYYRLLGVYFSSDQYDDEIRRDARARYDDDLAARADYYEKNRIRDDQAWRWASSEALDRYRQKRNDSNRSYKRAGYMIGIAAANRLLAAVDVIRIAHKRKLRAGDFGYGWQEPPGLGSRIQFHLAADLLDRREPARLCISMRLP